MDARARQQWAKQVHTIIATLGRPVTHTTQQQIGTNDMRVLSVTAGMGCVAATVLMTGCDGSTNQLPAIPAASPSPFNSTAAADPGKGAVVSPNGKPSSITPDNAQTIAQAAGCQDVRSASIAQTSDAVHCFIGKSSVDVVSFPTAAERDNFVADSSQGSSSVRVGQSGSVFWAALATGGTATDLQPFHGTGTSAS